MTYNPQQIIARGPRIVSESAAEAIDGDVLLEGATYSILEEDEDKNIWRIDAFPTTEEEDTRLQEILGGFSGTDGHRRSTGRCRLAGHGAVRPAAGASRTFLRLRHP